MKESIKLDDGKYEVVLDQTNNTFDFHALRHGEQWRHLTGDNLVLSMFQRIQELEELLTRNVGWHQSY